MFSLHELFIFYDLDPATIKLVRHGDAEIPIWKTYKEDNARFEAYQFYQDQNKFGNAQVIASFAPYFKTTAIFLGLWDINGLTLTADFNNEIQEELQHYLLPASWFNTTVRYNLHRNPTLDEFSERLVIEWGRSTRAWVQNRDKEILEIKAENTIGDFQSFDQIDLTFIELQQLVANPGSNQTWVKALSSVNGVYLIRDMATGRMYVGSAYGRGGIYNRWSTYAAGGLKNNQGLVGLPPQNFRFSILEIVPKTTTQPEVVACENRWKEKLGTRQFGLNNN